MYIHIPELENLKFIAFYNENDDERGGLVFQFISFHFLIRSQVNNDKTGEVPGGSTDL
jgi:hypothetical protein